MPEDEGSSTGEGRNPRFLPNHLDPGGVPRPDLWRQGIEDFFNMDVAASGLWTPIGPAGIVIDQDQIYQGLGPVSGEVTAIAIDPTGAADDKLYVATNDGGIWSISQGLTLKAPATDAMKSLSMGAVAIDPGSNITVYAGTGNLFDGGDQFTRAVGIYKSTDGAGTWSIVDGGTLGTLFADPGDPGAKVPAMGINRIILPAPNVLLVATNRGLFRSIDGGQNFGANAPKFDDGKPITVGTSTKDNISGLVLDTKTPTTLCACVSGKGIFQSTDGGQTFPTSLFRPDNVFDAHGALAYPAPFTDLVFAQSTKSTAGAANNSTLYTSVQYSPPNGSPVYRGLYRSVDSGASWIVRPMAKTAADRDGAGQTNYDLTLGVDPQDPASIYLGFQELWASADGGGAFGALAASDTKIHWDQHAIAFSPGGHWAPAHPPTRLYDGSDGGIATSPDGSAWDNSLNAGIATNLFVGIDIGRGNAANNVYTYGGCQDTGTSGHRDGDAPNEWHSGSNGDGGPVAVDPADPKRVYGSATGGFILSTDGGNTWTHGPTKGGAVPPPVGQNLVPRDLNDITTWTYRVVVDPSQNQNVYVTIWAGLYQSKDRGGHFNLLKTFSQNILCVTIAPHDSNRLWVGLSDGTVHMSSDGGGKWDQGSFNKNTGGAGPATGIALDPADAAGNRVVVVHAGHSSINVRFRTRHVFKTEDSGNNWEDISGKDDITVPGNLPDLPLHSAVIDSRTAPSTIVVATDGGVMRSTDLGISWQVMGVGLPTVDCTSLAFDSQTGLLRVGTYGRSCWEFTKPASQNLVVDANLAFGTVVTGQTAKLDLLVFNPGSADLHISDVKPVGGPGTFTVVNPPPQPAGVTVPAGGQTSFTVQYQPISDGVNDAVIEIDSNDPGSAAYLVRASGTATSTPSAPRLAVNANLGFGKVEKPNSRSITIQLSNTGLSDLHINAITRTDGSSAFSLDPAPALPATLHPGDTVEYSVKYQPTGNDNDKATFQVQSDDPRSPCTLKATGSGTGFFSHTLAIVLVVIGVAAVAGGIYLYEKEKGH